MISARVWKDAKINFHSFHIGFEASSTVVQNPFTQREKSQEGKKNH